MGRVHHMVGLTAIALSAFASSAGAQSAAGDWHGVLSLPAGDLRLAITIAPGEDGALGGSLESPDQASPRIPIENVALQGATVSFEVPRIRAEFKGDWDPERRGWNGQFIQLGQARPLSLAPGKLPPGPVVEGLDGDWSGAVERNGAKLRVIVRVRTGAYGTIATFDSPDQMITGLPITGLARSEDKVRFEQKIGGATFEGALAADGRSLAGTWRVRDEALPLTLVHRAPTAGPRPRPQTPSKPYPYREEEVAFDSEPGKVRLAGTLTLPQGEGPFPAVALLSGSGPQDRDETILGHKPFLVIADHLTRQGIAVLRFDDRGFGKSTGDFASATHADLARDAHAAIAYLKSRPEIDRARLGLIGHSEGGAIAPRVAGETRDVAFLVLIAAPGVPAAEVLRAQRRAIAPHMGMSPDEIDRSEAAFTNALHAMEGAKDQAEAELRAKESLARDLAPLGLSPQNIEVAAAQIASPTLRNVVGYDPTPILAKVDVPVLAINGSKDLQVPAEQNLAGLRARLKHNRDATFVELANLNHLLQTATTGAVGEYADIEETVSPAALRTISDWLAVRVGPGSQDPSRQARSSR